MRATLLPGGHLVAGSIHPHLSVWQQARSLLLLLALAHVAALGYWLFCLARDARGGRRGGGGGGVNDSVPRAMEAWRAPRDILRATYAKRE
jgi:hypothetical protein